MRYSYVFRTAKLGTVARADSHTECIAKVLRFFRLLH